MERGGSERRGLTGMHWMVQKSLESVVATGHTFLATVLYAKISCLEIEGKKGDV